jgi:hypothetical protein
LVRSFDAFADAEMETHMRKSFAVPGDAAKVEEDSS